MRRNVKEYEFEQLPYDDNNTFYLWVDYHKNNFTPILKLTNTSDIMERIELHSREEIEYLIKLLQQALKVFNESNSNAT